MKKGNHIKDFFKKNRGMLVLIFFMIITMGISFFTDYKLELFECDMIPLVSILFSTTTAIAGIWVTCYFLFIQLFRDRYPVEIIKETQSGSIGYTFVMVIYTILFGSVIMLIGKGIVSNIWFCLVAISTSLQVLFLAYNSNKTMMTNTHITKYCKNIQNDIEKNQKTITRESLRKIKDVLEESIIKEEYYTAANIVEKTGNIFRTFLKNAVTINISSDNDNVQESFERIVELNMFELKCCKHIRSEMLIRKIINQQYKNLVFCSDNGFYDRYKHYLKELNLFVYEMQKEGNDSLVSDLYSVYANTVLELLKSNKEKAKADYISHTFDQVGSLVSSLVFANEHSNTKSYMSFLTRMIYHAVENKNDELYNIVFEKIKAFSIDVFRNNKAFNSLKVYYSILFHKILDEDFNKAKDFVCEIFDSSHILSNESILLDFKQYCIGELQKNENLPDKDYKVLFNFHINTLEAIIKLKNDYHGTIYLPNCETKILSASSNTDIEDYIQGLKYLLNICVIRNNVGNFYTILDFVKHILSKTEKQQRETQEELLSVYFGLLNRCKDLVNKQFLEITFHSLKDVIYELDKENNVSSGLCDNIIRNLYSTARLDTTKEYRVTIPIIDLIYELMHKDDGVRFICKYTDKKQEVSRTLYNIGTDCLENNFEDGLRRVSNVIGWLTVYSIEQGTNELSKYLIDRAFELYSLSKKMEVSSKTQTFILTLFTTVGMFCCKSPTYYIFRKKIVEGLEKEEMDKIHVAISLRTSENDSWNDLFENKTQIFKMQFLDCFKK
ncbi:MAG: hypothetical protein IKU15_09635 [Clostridia bacterium]|nr:hypothetical protein [Clostridia bacterium]